MIRDALKNMSPLEQRLAASIIGTIAAKTGYEPVNLPLTKSKAKLLRLEQNKKIREKKTQTI